MIAMGMGDENVADGFAAHGVEQRRDMRVVVGAGIEDRHFAAADDVAHRAFEGERAGIVGHDRADARRDLAHRVGREVERLVEGDVLGHAALYGPARRMGMPKIIEPRCRECRGSSNLIQHVSETEIADLTMQTTGQVGVSLQTRAK